MPPSEECLGIPRSARRSGSLWRRAPFYWGALAIILATAAVIRCWNLSTPGLWQDELYSLELANGWGLSDQRLPLDTPLTHLPDMTHLRDARPIGEVLRGLRDDNHPPLYFLLLRGWQHLGESDAWLRGLSVLFSLAAIVLLQSIVTETSGPAAGLVAAALMALCGPQIEFAREVRNYMPMTTLALAAALPLVRMHKRGPSAGRCIAAALATMAMLLTHYFAIAVVAALGIWALIALRGSARRAALLSLAIGGAGFAMIWLPALLAQLPHFGRNNQWLTDPGPDAAITTLGLFWRLPLRLLLDPHSIFWLYMLEWLSGLLWMALIIAWLKRPAMRLWIAWIAATVAMVGASDLARHSHQLALIRYTLAATPAACALIAMIGLPLQANVSPSWKRFIPAIVAAALMALAVPDALAPIWKIDAAPDMRLIAENVQPGDVIVLIADDAVGAQQGALALSLQRNTAGMIPTPVVLLGSRASATRLAALAGHRLWVVGSNDLPIQQFVPGFVARGQWLISPMRPGLALGMIQQ